MKNFQQRFLNNIKSINILLPAYIFILKGSYDIIDIMSQVLKRSHFYFII
jgi:hypothetical protein